VLRAQRALRDASDQLKVLINDPELTIGSNVLLLPADAAVDEAISYSFLDSVLTAVRERPEIHRALLSIDNTSIREDVADNGRLPQLDLRAQMRFSSLGEDNKETYDELTEGDFVDYLIGLAFEMPIGNREAEAQFRQRRLERYQAVAAYHNTVQNIVAEVLRSLRAVAINYVLIEQTRVARYAEAENLRTLQAEFEGVLPQTPQLQAEQLRRQEALASAEQQEIGALVDYNVAISALHAAMGTALERNQILFDVPDADDVNDGYRLFPRYREPSPDEFDPKEAAEAAGVAAESPAAEEPAMQQGLGQNEAPVEPAGDAEIVP
jgi:outer membrane protein TolC